MKTLAVQRLSPPPEMRTEQYAAPKTTAPPIRRVTGSPTALKVAALNASDAAIKTATNTTRGISYSTAAGRLSSGRRVCSRRNAERAPSFPIGAIVPSIGLKRRVATQSPQENALQRLPPGASDP